MGLLNTGTCAHCTLIIFPIDDPITPVAAGRLLQDLMGNSTRHVVQEGAGMYDFGPFLLNSTNTLALGHSYLGPKSRCAIKIIQAYFDEGKIPTKDETHCNNDIANHFLPIFDE